MSDFTNSKGETYRLSLDPIIADQLVAIGCDIKEAVTGELFATMNKDSSLAYRAAWIMAGGATTVPEVEFYQGVGENGPEMLTAVVETIADFQVVPAVQRYLRAIAAAVIAADADVLEAATVAMATPQNG